ncbi:MAG: hypothetical protein ABIB47_06565 [Candidatus Woesearchaeota archaeon]
MKVSDSEINPKKKKKERQRTTASHTLVMALALVSILGFAGIISRTLFDYDPTYYGEALLMLIIGAGLVIEGQVFKLGRIKKEGLTPKNFTHLITLVVGAIAVVAGILSLPAIRVENQGFLAVKGILGVIAIVIIVIQTWIIE